MKINFSIYLLTAVFAMLLLQISNVNAAEQDKVEVTSANFYVAWGMSTLQNVEIVNSSDKTIKNPEVEFIYNNSYDNEKRIAKITLPLEIPANSKATYFKEGLNRLVVNSGGNAGMHTGKPVISMISPGMDSTQIVKIESIENSKNS